MSAVVAIAAVLALIWAAGAAAAAHTLRHGARVETDRDWQRARDAIARQTQENHQP